MAVTQPNRLIRRAWTIRLESWGLVAALGILPGCVSVVDQRYDAGDGHGCCRCGLDCGCPCEKCPWWACRRTEAASVWGVQKSAERAASTEAGENVDAGQSSAIGPRTNDLFFDGPTYDRGHYSGQVLNGKWHGFGTYSWANGQRYVGEIRDGKRHGYGLLTLPGGLYEGDWRNDTMHGHGTLVFADGTKAVGNWVAGKRHGQCRLILPDGTTSVSEWRDGKKIFGSTVSAKRALSSRLGDAERAVPAMREDRRQRGGAP